MIPVGMITGSGTVPLPSIRSIREDTAACPIASGFKVTAVSGGSAQALACESVQPAIIKSSGTFKPLARAASRTPRANWSSVA